MKLSFLWLKEFVDFDWNAAELAERLTMAGLEVESVVEVGGDCVLEAEVTPNRPDLMGHLGVGREISALCRNPLRPPILRSAAPSPGGISGPRISIEDDQDCLRYVGRVLRGQRVGPSPEPMRNRLESLGMRSVNNIVDVTNYVLLELGHPLHAFDYDRLLEETVSVRRARRGERILAIDAVERPLSEEILVIADARRPVAVAGIMGGQDTEITSATTNVLLESACFDPIRIRRGTKILGLVSESSARFEKGTDPRGVDVASRRAVDLLLQYAGGFEAGAADVHPRPMFPVSIELRPARVASLLGTSIPEEEMSGILRRLGMTVAEGEPVTVEVPTFRRDVSREVDLIEEIARVHGYNRIGDTNSFSRSVTGVETPGARAADAREESLREIRAILGGFGFSEAYTASFSNPQHLALVRPELEPRMVSVRNPLAAELSALRTTLISNLVAVAALNLDRMNSGLRLYELGTVYLSRGPDTLPEERVSLCLLETAERAPASRSPDRGTLYRSLKGILEGLGEALGWLDVRLERRVLSPFHPGCSAALMVDGKEVGRLGEWDDTLPPGSELREHLGLLDLDLEQLLERGRRQKRFRPLPRYPSIERDLALIVDGSTPFDLIQAAVNRSGAGLVEEVTLFDLYRGQQIPAGKQGLGLRLRFRSREGTLSEEDVRPIQADILASLQREFGAVLRA
jgi:phenylalanyl-tRNA synthetase beta chain